MNRPLDLHLVPNETFPAERMNTADIQVKTKVIGGMQDMTKYTYELYMKKVQVLKEAMVSPKIYNSGQGLTIKSENSGKVPTSV